MGLTPEPERAGHRVLDDFEDKPLHRFIGARLIDPAHPEQGVQFTVHEGVEGRPGALYFGVVGMLLDAAAYLALSPHLGPDEDAVTHDIHQSVLRPVATGETVELRGRLVQRGRRVAFLDAEARVGDRVVATGRFTKTIVPLATS